MFTNKSKLQIGVNKFVIKRWNDKFHHFVWKPIPYINNSNRKIIGASIILEFGTISLYELPRDLMMLLKVKKSSWCKSTEWCSIL